MMSRTYDPVAKRFVSLGEMKPVDFAGFPFRREAKRKNREIDGGFRARAMEAARLLRLRAQRLGKWRRKLLESLEMDSQMAIRGFGSDGLLRRIGQANSLPAGDNGRRAQRIKLPDAIEERRDVS
jgi:hypothetical protein